MECYWWVPMPWKDCNRGGAVAVGLTRTLGTLPCHVMASPKHTHAADTTDPWDPFFFEMFDRTQGELMFFFVARKHDCFFGVPTRFRILSGAGHNTTQYNAIE